ncbi:hypothetical protein A7U60_g3263 [Sanghuangporus baumii]|uniref:Pentacotripeptide-repeat region of PRORP domain-containing protein n=1 Tax=Sanghuangporus baumii TaxID=108892 RepID=A0A9Q5I111_SANBA|nr:hypothetical protein A7U60_g3263 [Sanghuangporus baumii]
MFSRSIASAASIPIRRAATLSSPRTQSTRSLNFRDKNFPNNRSSLQEVWEALSESCSANDIRLVGPPELFGFGGRILRENGLAGEVLTNPNEWGHRVEKLVFELKKRVGVPSPVEVSQLECLSVVAQALQGRSEEAATVLHSYLEQGRLKTRSATDHQRWVLDTFKHTLLSLLRHISGTRAIEFYLDNHKLLAGYLKIGLAGAPHRSSSRLYKHLVTELSAICKAIDSPAAFLSSRKNIWEKERISLLGGIMIHVFCLDGLAEDALAVYEELRHQKIPVSYFLEHSLVRALAKMQRFERANLLYISTVPRSSDQDEARSYDSTGLYLFAYQGDVERAEDCFERLASKGGVLPLEMNLVMHASAKQGDTKRITELFNEFFEKPSEDSVPRPRRPNTYHYATMINAYSVRDDISGMNKWLDRMLADGYTPDLATYNIILKGVAQRDDMQSLNTLLDQMRDSAVPPNINSYTTIIKILARRRDVLGAEAMFKRMVREGITLDRIAITTLMNAHVEAGSWRGVIRIFDYISASQLRDIKLGVEVFNTLLKAYVLIGAPLDVVIRIFQRLEKADIKPTNRTFALLIQSACSAGRIDIASKLFVKMENLEKDWTTDVDVTKEVLTIIMAAYLRIGNRAQARVIYEDMQRRGIQPTAYTYASILRSYSDAGFAENMRIAQEFLDSLVSIPPDERGWVQPAFGREDAMAFVYAPLINAHAKKLDVEMAEQLYQEFMEHSKHPTIGILALLMDAYRRAGDIDGVQRVWPQVFDLACKRTDEADALLDTDDVKGKFFRSRRRGDLLCIPLSIYIDALSHAGKHIEIAHTWNKLRENGFQFDAHNWNHLVVALVRAGQPVRAFEVVEKVILPYQLQSHHIIRERTEKVDSPLLFDKEEIQKEIEEEPFIAKIERSHFKRPHLLERLRRRFRGVAFREPPNMAHELHLMQQISPEWNVWRPNNVTLQVLARVLERLDSGRLIRAMEPPARRPDEEDFEGASMDEVVAETPDSRPPSTEEVEEARMMLNDILSDYPKTIMKIDKWEVESVQQASKHSKRFVRQTKFELLEMGRGRI